MSAVMSNSGDRELEALRRAQRAHEPSMEEILASIRTIIADDRDAAPAKADQTKSGPHRPTSPPSAPQVVYSKDAPGPQPAQATAQPPEVGQTPEAHVPKVVWRQSEPAGPKCPEEEASGENGALVSPETDEAVTLAFGTLSAQLAARSAEIADGMIREMLRPMLKTWLDENLPSIVERLVGAEIKRLARGAS